MLANVAHTLKLYGVKPGHRVAVNAACSTQGLHALRSYPSFGVIPGWMPKVTVYDLAEHLTDFCMTTDATCVESNTLECNRLGIPHFPVHSIDPLIFDGPPTQVVLQVPLEDKCLEVTKAQLEAQVNNLRGLIEGSEGIVILSSGNCSSWILSGIAFESFSPVFLNSVNIDKFPGQFSLITNFQAFEDLVEMLKFANPADRKIFISRIDRIIVDLPSTRTQKDLEISSQFFRGSNFQWHCTSPETGSIFLANRELTKITKFAEEISRKIENGFLQVKGPGVSVSYLDRTRSTAARILEDGWIATNFQVSLTGSPVIRYKPTPVQKTPEPVEDLMRPSWRVDSMPLTRMRMRRGSKGQLYLTNKSQVSAFYRPKYFHRQTIKSRAVVRK